MSKAKMRHRALDGHRCSAYCTSEVHCDLAYFPAAMSGHPVSIARHYGEALHVQVVRVKPATEARDLADIPPEHQQLLVGSTPQDGQRWLVWWRLPAGPWVPPTQGEVRQRLEPTP